jgi:hypothetical protein
MQYLYAIIHINIIYIYKIILAKNIIQKGIEQKKEAFPAVRDVPADRKLIYKV